MQEIIETQTLTEVQQIDERREMANTIDTQIVEQTNNMEMINDQLVSISNTVDNISVSDVDFTEVTDKLDEFDSTMITTQNKDILETLVDQQNQINSIEEKINTILNAIEEMK